jgi:hypothetical protein
MEGRPSAPFIGVEAVHTLCPTRYPNKGEGRGCFGYAHVLVSKARALRSAVAPSHLIAEGGGKSFGPEPKIQCPKTRNFGKS